MATKMKTPKTIKRGTHHTTAAAALALLPPERVELTLNMPGLEQALVGLVQAAIAHAEQEHVTPDPHEAERLKLEAARIALYEDRQKLAWAEHRHRVREWEGRQKLLEQGKSAY